MLVESLIEFRRRLRAHPELAHSEHETARRVIEFLAELRPDQIITEIGGTGVIATFESGADGPTVRVEHEVAVLLLEHSGGGASGPVDADL